MQQHIGSTQATAWVEHITLPLGLQAKRAKELEEFTQRLHPLFGLGEPLDVTTRKRMETFFGYNLGDVRIHREHASEEASRQLGARAFTFRGHIFAPDKNLDVSSTEGLGLLAHELTHAIQQTEPPRLPQGQTLNRDTGSMPAAPYRSQSGTEMVLMAPARNLPLANSPQPGEAQAQASEQLVAEVLAENRTKPPPEIDREELARRVYYLMQEDVNLEWA